MINVAQTWEPGVSNSEAARNGSNWRLEVGHGEGFESIGDVSKKDAGGRLDKVRCDWRGAGSYGVALTCTPRPSATGSNTQVIHTHYWILWSTPVITRLCILSIRFGG